MEDFKYYPKSNIVVRKNSNGKVQIIKLHPQCHPSQESLSPKSLNKIVDWPIIKEMRAFFENTQNNPIGSDHQCGYLNLPNQLFDQLIQQLDLYEAKLGNQQEKPKTINENLINKNPIDKNPIKKNPMNKNPINENPIDEIPINENRTTKDKQKQQVISTSNQPINSIENIKKLSHKQKKIEKIRQNKNDLREQKIKNKGVNNSNSDIQPVPVIKPSQKTRNNLSKSKMPIKKPDKELDDDLFSAYL